MTGSTLELDRKLARRLGTVALAVVLVVSTEPAASLAQGRRVVDIVTMGDGRSELEHDLAGDHLSEGVVDGRVFRRASGWLRLSMAVYDDTEVTLAPTFQGTAGEPLVFELLVEGRQVKVPSLVPKSTGPSRFEIRVPMALTQGKTRISITLRATNGPTPGLIELRTVQEHLEVC